MSELLEGGTTLLFVSHNIKTVREVCDHAIWLDKGKMKMSGEVAEVCDAYQEEQDRLDFERRQKKREKNFKKKGKVYDYLVVGSGLYGAVFAREMENAEKDAWYWKKGHMWVEISIQKKQTEFMYTNMEHIFSIPVM